MNKTPEQNNDHAALLAAWAQAHPRAAAALCKVLADAPNGGRTVYLPAESTSCQARATA